jgi:hypothetical protein
MNDVEKVSLEKLEKKNLKIQSKNGLESDSKI